MLVIYSANATSFSNLGLGVLRDFAISPEITEVLNGEYNLEFEYITNGWLAEYLLKDNIIKANGQLFRIHNVKPDLKRIKILAKHIFFDLSKNFLDDVAPTKLTGNNALKWILDRTETPTKFKVNGDCTNISSARYVRKNTIDAIYNEDNSILKRFGGELELDNYNIYLHQKRGKDSGFTILHGKNLTGINVEMDFSTIVTRIMPQGKDGLLLEEKYIDSPFISNYHSPLYKKIEFNEIGIDEENGIDIELARKNLREAAIKLFSDDIDKPNISIKIDFIELSKTIEYKKYTNLEKVDLGDTVKIIIPKFKLNSKIRVVKTVYNCLLNRITKLELGSITPNIVTEQSKNNRDTNSKLEQINVPSILGQAQDNATKLINHPFKGNLIIDEKTGEIFLLDTKDKATAKMVWKWSLGGFGFSSNGINGPFETAITQDGKIVADFIAAGKINTNLIEGYEELLLSVNKMVNLVQEKESTNYLILDDAMPGTLQELIIEGPVNLLYPNNDLHPSDDLYPVDSYLIIDRARNLTEDAKKIYLPVLDLKENEKLVLKPNDCYIIRQDNSIEKIDDVNIELFDGINYIYLESFQDENIKLSVKYVAKNQYTDILATKVEMSNIINQTNERTDIELSKKVGNDEIIAKINMSTEKDNDGSYIGIEADKLNFKGKEFNLTSENISIKSDKFSVDKFGKVNCKDLVVDGGDITLIDDFDGTSYFKISSHYYDSDTFFGNFLSENLSNGYRFSGAGSNYGTTFETNVELAAWGSSNFMPFLSLKEKTNGTSYETYVGTRNIVTPKLTQTSLKSNKKNFELFKKALDEIKNIDIYKYNLKFEDDTAKKHLGFVIGNNFNYSKIVTNDENDGVDLYSFISLCVQAVKEQQLEIEELKNETKELREMIKNGV